MQATIITNQQGERFVLRQLTQHDVIELSHFFANLSDATLSRYAPHPMTAAYACDLCQNCSLPHPPYVVTEPSDNKIIGYMILDGYSQNNYPEDASRYQNYPIKLTNNSRIFAPCIADNYQNKGIASAAMPAIVQQAITQGVDHIALMGGVQTSNAKAVRFYQKAGFVELGQFTTLDKKQQPLDNLDMALTLAVRDSL